MKKLYGVILTLCAFTAGFLFAGDCEISKNGNIWNVSGKNYSIDIDSTNGAILKIVSVGKDTGVSIPEGLWTAHFRNEKPIHSVQFPCEVFPSGDRLEFKYSLQNLDVSIFITPKKEYCDFQAKLNVKSGELMEFELPATFKFKPESVKDITLHSSSPRNTGLSLSSKFFIDHSALKNSDVYTYDVPVGDKVYKHIFGANCPRANDMGDFANNVTKGKDTDAWIPQDVHTYFFKTKFNVARPLANPDIEIATSKNGCFIGGVRLGGKGALFRVGGWYSSADSWKIKVMAYCIYEHLHRISVAQKSNRLKIGLINFKGLDTSARSWAEQLPQKYGKRYFEITSPEELVKAMENPDTLYIINPYSETFPNMIGEPYEKMADRIVAYVKGGGHWFDSNGLSFYRGIKKRDFYHISSEVPATVADFFHFDMNGAKFVCYSVQNIKGTSFENHTKSFTTSKFSVGGAKDGGYLKRPFTRYLKAGYNGKWESPKVRLNFAKDLQESADAFCKANGVTKKFSQKMDKDLRRKFVESVLFKIQPYKLSEVKLVTEALPKNNIIHLWQYLKGGFDKEYPDHVPPSEKFGTEKDFKEFIAEIRAQGHLFMPYTNNTWWCDNPRGPTFVAAGEAPLSVDINGKNYYEVYGVNDGWTVCMWHPATRAANKKMAETFVDEYPCDILFQDQTGARASKLDFNPAAKDPNTYSDGFIYQAREDSKLKPLSTEDGWWGIANEEVQFCGMTFGIFEPNIAPTWSAFIGHTYPKSAVRMNNLVGALFHDKVSLSHHDLATGIYTQRQLSLSLGIGYTMMYSPTLHRVRESYHKAFIYFMDRLQKTLVSKYIGAKMKGFEHRWKDFDTNTNEGYIRSQYGDIKIFASMDSKPFKEGDILIAPDGYIAEGDGVKSAHVLSINGVEATSPCSYIIDENEKTPKVWVFGKAENKFIFPTSAKIKSLKLPDGKSLAWTQNNGVVQFTMPDVPEEKNKYIFTEIIIEN